MTTWNRAQFLEEAYQSILGQTYANWELVIVDDASHDPFTLASLLHYSQVDKRVRVFLQHRHAGVLAAKNRGYLEARGDYVAVMDDDDLMLPERIEKSVREFLHDPGLGIVSVGMSYVNASGGYMGSFAKPPQNYEWFRLQLLFGNVIGNPNVMLNKKLLGEVGCYDFVFGADWYLWLKLIFDGD